MSFILSKFAYVLIMMNLLTGICTAEGEKKEETAKPDHSVLITLKEEHPRLLLTDDDLQWLKQAYQRDPLLQKCVNDTIDRANQVLKRPKIKYEKKGIRLLHVSRECVYRIYHLGIAWRWTGDKKYADKMIENLQLVCRFSDWNQTHFLDTAEMSNAVGIGYDWLYSYMDKETREEIRKGLIELGLEKGLNDKAPWNWWKRCDHNWNQVCFGGMMVGSLAIAETDPEYAEFYVNQAIEKMPNALKNYGPDGAWMEGPSYWAYATRYTAYGLGSLQTALNRDFQLTDIEGLSITGYEPIYLAGPTRYFLNFADAGEKRKRSALPSMFWLARTFNNRDFANDEAAVLAKSKAEARHVIWYTAPGKASKKRDLCRYFRGPVELAVFRSEWDNPNALFAGIKAGFNLVNHAHLDLGTFELDALGQRWVRDLGSDDYDLPYYWEGSEGGKRWDIYRLGSKSHSIITLNDEHQRVKATSSVVKYEDKNENPRVVIDLTEAYKPNASKATRGLMMVADKRAVLLQDELNIEKPCSLAWGITTDAKLDVSKGTVATMSLGGKTMFAKIISPAGATFTVESAEQEKPQKQNKGVSRLMIRMDKASGSQRIAVLFSPDWPDGGAVSDAKILPLDQW